MCNCIRSVSGKSSEIAIIQGYPGYVYKEPANPPAGNRSNVGLPRTAFILGFLEPRSVRIEEKT